jgi:hypothetical protein
VQGTFGRGSEDDVFLQRVISETAGLGPGESVTIAECAPERATRWEVRLDPIGTPVVTAWSVPWPDLAEADGTLSAGKLDDHIRPTTPGERLLTAHVHPASGTPGPADSPDSPDAIAFSHATRLYPDAPVYHLTQPAGDLIRAARKAVPLTQWYELAALRPGPDGRLILTTRPLFPPGAVRGDQRPFGTWVEPAEDPRTAFVVLAHEDDADTPHYRVVSQQSALLPAGPHQVTARLLRPGLVRFDGLPEPLSDDPRTWDEVQAAIPVRIPVFHPAHLIIVIELCEPQLRYAQRVDCAVRLIADVADGARAPVRYSLVGYGSHAYVRMTREDPIEELCWGDDAPMALGALGRLGNRKALADGSKHGAKLECALHHVAGRLAAGNRTDERLVLVGIGTRPPFPHEQGTDAALPCGRGLDWRKVLQGMTERHGGMTFGAIYDGEPAAEAWLKLGSHAHGWPSAFASRQFAGNLGLITPGLPAMPLPLLREP